MLGLYECMVLFREAVVFFDMVIENAIRNSYQLSFSDIERKNAFYILKVKGKG